MLNKCIPRTCIALLISGTFGTSTFAATRTVGQPGSGCPNAKYTSIGAAVSAAGAGDVIEICPGLYPEQLIIAKPLTLRGISSEVNGLTIDRVLLQPALQDLQGLATEAVITVMNTHDVTIENLAVDASRNSVSGCSPSVADIHFHNASGRVDHDAIFGAELTNPQSCTTLPFGNGFGVRVDSNQPGPFHVSVNQNSIHDYMCNGVVLTGAGISGDIAGNNISGVGPSGGVFQFGVFIINGAVGHIQWNVITEGLCGAIIDLTTHQPESVGWITAWQARNTRVFTFAQNFSTGSGRIGASGDGKWTNAASAERPPSCTQMTFLFA